MQPRGPSLTTWCKYRRQNMAPRDSPRDARRTLNAILRASRRLGVRVEDLGRLRGAHLVLEGGRLRPKRKSLAHDPDFLAAGILFALMIAVLAGVLAAMLVADTERASDLPGNKSMGGGALNDAMLRARADAGRADLDDGVEDAGMAVDDYHVPDDVPEYLLEFLQNHRNHQHLEEDVLYHDDYRERYDGFDQPPPFRQRHKAAPSSSPARPRTVSDLEISEEEAFSTRVFVTTPRKQR